MSDQGFILNLETSPFAAVWMPASHRWAPHEQVRNATRKGKTRTGAPETAHPSQLPCLRARLVPSLGIYFSVRRFRRVLDKWASVPWKSQRRKVEQLWEEKAAELPARLRCGKEATRLNWHHRQRPGDTISAANWEKPENELLPCTSKGSRLERKRGLEVWVETAHRRQGELFRKMCFVISFWLLDHYHSCF